MRTFDSLVDIIFIIDIILRFRTTFIDPVSGDEIGDTFLIARRYLTSANFYIDVLSTIPINNLIDGKGGTAVDMLGLLKLLRIARISAVIMNLNTSQEMKAAYKVMNLVFIMFLYIHVTGCFWFFIVKIEE